MTKRFFLLLLFFLNVFSGSFVIIPSYWEKKLTAIEKTLILMVKGCNLRLNNFMFYTGNNSDLTTALLMIQPSVDLNSWILVSTPEYKEYNNLTAINGYVIVSNSKYELNGLMWHIVHSWKCSENCQVIFLIKNPNLCYLAPDIVENMGYWYYDITYVICIEESVGAMVLTVDKYQNIRRPQWMKLKWKVDSLFPGSFYVRKASAGICRDLHFNREKPKKNIRIMIGVKIKVTKEIDMFPSYVYDGNISKFKRKHIPAVLEIFEKLLKVKFVYYIQPYLHRVYQENEDTNYHLWFNTPVDMISTNEAVGLVYRTVYLTPTYYETLVIVSHKPDDATPLEKIAKFYGIWTLVSLIIISSIIFGVIYLKTNKNSAAAAFDVLRLLINSGVKIPINTFSLKIFFCAIFLYFMIIHATFSGNLAKFLTIPDFHDTVDTPKDLENPRITTIYHRGIYEYFSADESNVITKKLVILTDPNDLYNHFEMDRNSVCISTKQAVIIFISFSKFEKRIHISKSHLGQIMAAKTVRHRFFLQEKFRWASAYIFDIGGDIDFLKYAKFFENNSEKVQILSQVKFRQIAVNDLNFAFIFLGIGNILGLICFLVELVIARKSYRKITSKYLKKCMTFRLRKKTNVRRIVVKPKPTNAQLEIEKTA